LKNNYYCVLINIDNDIVLVVEKWNLLLTIDFSEIVRLLKPILGLTKIRKYKFIKYLRILSSYYGNKRFFIESLFICCHGIGYLFVLYLLSLGRFKRYFLILIWCYLFVFLCFRNSNLILIFLWIICLVSTILFVIIFCFSKFHLLEFLCVFLLIVRYIKSVCRY